MEIIRGRLMDGDSESLARVALPVDRLTLAKRRWRSQAADGQEFGFDLEETLSDGDVFFQTAQARYEIEQKPEPVLEVLLASAEDAARLGWSIGNLHFQIAVLADRIHVPADPAVCQLLERAGIAYEQKLAVFRPLRGSHSHGSHSH